jgi:predicted GTPase
MSKTHKDSQKSKASRKGRERHISVRAVRRDPPDLRKLSRALITLAMAEAAAEAAAQAQTKATDQSATEPESTKGSDV